MEIAVHGLGYVGLTAAVHWALKGHRVVGYDPDEKTIQGILSGKPRAGEFLGYLDANVKRLVESGLLNATTSPERIKGYKIHSIAIPTERGGVPFDGYIDAKLEWLAMHTPPGTLVLVESTLTPGTIDRLLPRLRRNVGHDFFLAVCPRRDWFADQEKNLATLPRIVGGVTPECTERAIDVLSQVSWKILPTTYRTAELTKALENALLHVPVMFAHQLAWALPEHDVAEALRLAGTHWRLTPLYLGFGSGGRCVPLGTQYLVHATNGRLKMGEEAVAWDAQMRALIAEVVARRLEARSEKTALVLGIAYRPNFRDAGLSPGMAVAKHLHERGMSVFVHDPMWTTNELHALTGLPVYEGVVGLDAWSSILLATPHEQYLSWPYERSLWKQGQFVLDGQGAWAKHRQRLANYGVQYVRVGEPGWLGKGEER